MNGMKFIRKAGKIIPIGQINKAGKMASNTKSKISKHAKEYTDASKKLSNARKKPSKRNGNVDLYKGRTEKAVKSENHQKSRLDKINSLKGKAVKQTKERLTAVAGGLGALAGLLAVSKSSKKKANS